MAFRSYLTLLIAAFLTAACVSVAPPAQMGTAKGPTPQSVEQATPVAVELLPTVSETTREAEPSTPAAPGAPVIAVQIGLLQSFLAKTEVRVETLAPEVQLETWTQTETRRSGTAGTADLLTAIRVTDLSSSEVGETSDMILATDVVYLKGSGDSKWMRVNRDSGVVFAQDLLTPDEIAQIIDPVLAEATIVGIDESVDDIGTTHIQLVGPPLARVVATMMPEAGELTSGQMDVWIAPQGYVKQLVQDYVVKDATGRQARHTLTMLVLSENAPQDITLPAEGEYQDIVIPGPPTQEPADAVPTTATG